MRGFTILAAGTLVAVCAAGGAATSRGQSAEGRVYFERYCVTCHGAEGKGDGPLASGLRQRPADLTKLTRQNGGVFPAERVRMSIDGRARRNAPSHTDMPRWGEVLSKSADAADDVKGRIDVLVKYVEELQSK
jgi:mono/diheme cytochrome c family protein